MEDFFGMECLKKTKEEGALEMERKNDEGKEDAKEENSRTVVWFKKTIRINS